MSKDIKYKPGELHALRLDANTVALIMPVDCAATLRDVLGHIGGHPYRSRRMWTAMMFQALHGLKDFPQVDTSDIDQTRDEIHFNDNQVVLL